MRRAWHWHVRVAANRTGLVAIANSGVVDLTGGDVGCGHNIVYVHRAVLGRQQQRRARRIHGLGQVIIDRHSGQVHDTVVGHRDGEGENVTRTHVDGTVHVIVVGQLLLNAQQGDRDGFVVLHRVSLVTVSGGGVDDPTCIHVILRHHVGGRTGHSSCGCQCSRLRRVTSQDAQAWQRIDNGHAGQFHVAAVGSHKLVGQRIV